MSLYGRIKVPQLELTAAQIAEIVGGRLAGNPEIPVSGVNGIAEAGPGDLVFVRGRRYFDKLESTRARVVLVPEEVPGCTLTQIIVGNPDLAFVQVLERVSECRVPHPTGIHPSAVIGEGAVLGTDVAIDANVRIAARASIGDRAVLYAGVYVGAEAQIGPDCVVYPNTTIREHCELGARCIIHANTVIGSDGFGFVPGPEGWFKIPQVGRVVLGDDVEVGSNTAIDRATFGITRIGRGTKIDNLVQIGHNVQVGEHCVIAGKVGIAGSASIGNRVRIGAQAGINGHIEIGDGASIGARAGVTASVPAGATVSGFPAIDHNQQRRVMVAQTHLPEIGRRLRQMERRLEELEQHRHEQATDNRG